MPLRDPQTTTSLPSRRAALFAGAGALTALALGAPRAQAATSAFSAGSLPAGGSTRTLPLAAARGSARLLSATEGGLATVTLDVAGGSMVGVSFPAGTTASSVALRVRRDAGAWSDWTALELHDSEPDPGTADAASHVAGSDPLWVGELGGAAQVQVRLPAADVATASLAVVDPGARSTDAAIAASSADVSLKSSPAGADDLGADLRAVAAPLIRSRAEWGADESIRKGAPGYSGTIKACVVHHTADPGSYSQSEVPAVIRGMYRYHTVTLGWSDLGYNFVVDRFGGIWEGRAGGITLPVVGAHAGGFNTDTFGVSMIAAVADAASAAGPTSQVRNSSAVARSAGSAASSTQSSARPSTCSEVTGAPTGHARVSPMVCGP